MSPDVAVLLAVLRAANPAHERGGYVPRTRVEAELCGAGLSEPRARAAITEALARRLVRWRRTDDRREWLAPSPTADRQLTLPWARS